MLWAYLIIIIILSISVHWKQIEILLIFVQSLVIIYNAKNAYSKYF